MTVAELIEALQTVPPGLTVYRYAGWPVEGITLATDTPETDDRQHCVTLY